MVWSAVRPQLWIQPKVIHRFILSPVTEPLTVLTPCTARHVFHPIDPPAEPNTGIGLVWCTGQAWIRILDLVRNQLEHTPDLSLLCRRPSRGWTRRGCVREHADKRSRRHHLATRHARAVPIGVRARSCHAACVSCADRSTSLPSCHAACSSLGARIRHHRLVTSRIRAFDTYPLVNEASPSTPCLVCMSSRPKVYLARVPLEIRIRSSLVKSGL